MVILISENYAIEEIQIFTHVPWTYLAYCREKRIGIDIYTNKY